MYTTSVHINIVAQLIGFMALIAAIAVYQYDGRKKMLYILLFTALLFAVHYSLLGAWSGVAMNVIAGARSIVFTRTRKTVWLYIFLISFTAAGIVTWQSAYSVLPIVGMLSGTIAFWMKNSSRIRYIALLSPPVWFVYNLIVGSYAGLFAEVFIFGSILIGIRRFDNPAQSTSAQYLKKATS